MIRITDILENIADYDPDADIEMVRRAYVYSARVHDGQMRLSGEPYLSHPLEVANILADMKLDCISIASGLLHDVIEDTHVTEEELREMFGDEILRVVNGVTKISGISFDSSQKRQAENIRKMILAMADDIRVILIKLADRLHNIRTLVYHKPEKRIYIARETLDIYAPLASRLGIYWIKKELEDHSFKHFMPEEYAKIKAYLNTEREERDKYIIKVKELIEEKMDSAGVTCEVLGRYKHLYSIHRKMVTQNLPIEEIYDIIAFRIIVDTISDCYLVLGMIHNRWSPIPTKIKDYISVPKQNMYQSLHTTVVGPGGKRIEIQIRTHEMDMVAKSGIAAHWSYKEGLNADKGVRQRLAWIQDLVENQTYAKDPNEFLENVRIDLFPDDVYVFTPAGDIKILPVGSTPIDFAYAVHTDVGNETTGAKVDGKMVPLNYELQTGDSVKITTTKGHKPSRDWLKFVKSVKARNRIRQWIRTEEKERSISLGREMCEKAFRKNKLDFASAVNSDRMEEILKIFGFKTTDDLIANVGYGKITPLQIINKYTPKPEKEEDQSIIDMVRERHKRKKAASGGVMVHGMDDILIKFAKCCKPVPGDPITGYITRGQGVAVHRTNCINALNLNPERQIDVSWDTDADEFFPVGIKVVSLDRVGLLADIAAKISESNANILSVNSPNEKNSEVNSFFEISVYDTGHLRKVFDAIRRVESVIRVERVS